MDQTQHHLFDTPIGVCGVAWNTRGLCAVQLPEKDPPTTERRLAKKSGSTGPGDPPPAVQALLADIQNYLGGERVDFSGVAVDLSGIDDLRCRIYQALRGIALGR